MLDCVVFEKREITIECFLNINENSNKGYTNENAKKYRRGGNTADVTNVRVFSERLQHLGGPRQGC